MQINRLPVILNAFSASAATDIQTNAGYLYIGSAGTTNYVPRMYYPNGQAIFLKSQIETLSSYLVTGSVANSTVYSFTIIQRNLNTNVNNTFPVFITSDSTALDAEIATALSNFITGLINGGGLKAAVSGSAITTGLTITGLTGYPPLTIVAGSNVTVANNLSVANVSSTNATPIVMTTAATTYAVGQIVVISGHTTNTAANGTWRVRATNGTTTVTLEHLDGSDSVGNGVGGATGTTVKQASLGIGSGAQVASAVSASGSTGTAISADTYSTVVFNGADINSSTMTTMNRTQYQQVLYLDEAGSNYAAFRTGLINELNGLNLAGSAADAELIAAY